MKIRAYAPPYYDGIDILIGGKDERGVYQVVEQLVVTDKPLGECISPTMTITRTEAQILMDSLWDCGIRPTEGHGSAGSLAATERHLADMRALVFKTKSGEL